MEPYYEDELITIYHGDCREFDGSADVIITDPPYGLEFMGKEWDKLARPKPGNLGGFADGNKPSFARVERYLPAMQEWHYSWCKAMLGKAGWLFAFGGTRTWHRLACAIEDSGWQMRDTMMWLYGQGFPKGKNTLKPAWEPIIVARKYGDLDIDAARIGLLTEQREGGWHHAHIINDDGWTGGKQSPKQPQGRWPANLILDEEAGRLLDEQSGELVSGANPTRRAAAKFKNAYGEFEGQTECVANRGIDTGRASRFFYCAKASREERERNLLGLMPCVKCGGMRSKTHIDEKGGNVVNCSRNNHPTVKPLKLMEYLITLSGGQTILDPFMGSGSTLVAAKGLGRKAIGIEVGEHSCEIAANRIRQHRQGMSDEEVTLAATASNHEEVGE